MAWVYGSAGTTDLDAIALSIHGMVQGQDSLDASLLLGLLLVIVGLGFKMAAVPFHFWTPDAYDGAPTPVTGFMSVVPKAAAFAAAVRLLIQGLGPLRDDWVQIIAILAAITMVFGNLVAISQRNVKRMLAYSSIAHTGYMMAGLAAYRVQAGFGSGEDVGDQGISSVLYYLLAYTFMNIGAFAIVVWIQHRGRGMELEDYQGLASTHPLPAAAMTVFLISLMGIPPTIGFYAKYYVIVALLDADLLWLATRDRADVGRERVLLPPRGGHDVLQRRQGVQLRTRRPRCSMSGSPGWWSRSSRSGSSPAASIDLADTWTTALTLAAQAAP